MTIQRNKTSNKFCGPAALAALTGRHVDDAALTLRLVSGKRAIKGISTRYMLAAIDRLGYKATTVLQLRPRGRLAPTLTQLLAGALKGRQATARYLVLITGHYVTIEGRKLVDNRHPEGIALTQCPYRRRRVKGAWLVEPGLVPAAPLPAPPMNLSRFTDALDKLNLETDGEYIDAPRGHVFQSSLHSLAITGTYEEALASLVGELPVVPCRHPECDCAE